jgi:hypothetical protein
MIWMLAEHREADACGVWVVPVFSLFQHFYKKIKGNYILTLLGKCWNSEDTGTLSHRWPRRFIHCHHLPLRMPSQL